jgi:Putative polyhydroxyalkanoic acid system protein (PHA_gran_rgn)
MPSYTRKVSLPGKNASELYEQASLSIDRFVSKAAVKFDIQRVPEKKEIHLKSSMATARLICTDGVMEVEAKLSLMATPFRSKIDEGIDKWIAKTFAPKV